MAMTPMLWRLEPVLHMELAGHSGPSDWIFLVMTIFVVVGLFLVFRVALKRRPEMTP
ncbi:MAG: hypothetical protein KGN79_05405 [Acidobacteriota bacterium]|nr:hypothetical protein [Acidobacteriota bacterium]